MKLLMFFVLPKFLSVSARGSPTNWSHDDGAVFSRHPDDNLHPANHWSTAPSCPGIKFIENIVHTTSSAGTSTAAAIKELRLRQRASGHGGSAAMKLLMFFVLPQVVAVRNASDGVAGHGLVSHKVNCPVTGGEGVHAPLVYVPTPEGNKHRERQSPGLLRGHRPRQLQPATPRERRERTTEQGVNQNPLGVRMLRRFSRSLNTALWICRGPTCV
ncbi:hypothetical protein HPB47_004049 [Ixodes persulcatus]|uniref:Uncharacterized protein n=1 Tax=Ixodes persulcatus TaxID=34615 RepID=A0AC60PHT3_IXOPE|nr:hypothetical protein HPB47_004049 [Ixodes persulcatus]